MSDVKNKFNNDKEKGKGRVAKGFFGLIFDGVKDNKDNIKKKSFILKEKRKGNNNLPKVYNLRKTHIQEFKGVLLHLP